MKRYFSSAVCSNGYINTFNTIYKSKPSSDVHIIYCCDDFERSVFFEQLQRKLPGYNITLFNTFYDDSVNGIFVENTNTYILSDQDYCHITPLLPGAWEKHTNLSEGTEYPPDLVREIIQRKNNENRHYKKACVMLKKASTVKEQLHIFLSPYLNENKIINFIHKLYSRAFRNISGNGNVSTRLLSSPTPLGMHTHYDTIFQYCDKILNITDDCGFVSSVLLGVIKNHTVKNKIDIISSPSYFGNDFYQFIIFPTMKIGICASDSNHILPFSADETVSASEFFTNRNILDREKVKALLSVESSFLDKAVLSLYEGRNERFRYNNLLSGYSDADSTREKADRFFENVF